MEILHVYLPEIYERRVRSLSQIDAKAIVIAKRLYAFRLIPIKPKVPRKNTDYKLSPSNVMYSTQVACKYKKFYLSSKSQRHIDT